MKSVYGDPISAHGKTIIPVARIAYGFGGGSGKKQGEANPRTGEGGGGGAYARPIGVVEITETGTRFIVWNEGWKLFGAALTAFCLGTWWARRR